MFSQSYLHGTPLEMQPEPLLTVLTPPIKYDLS